MKLINTKLRLETLKVAIQEYNSYGNEWEKTYFDEFSPGYVVVNKERIAQGNINKQEKKKYEKEFNMCLTLAKNGYKVEFLKMTDGSFDIYLNGISADLKKTASHNNMLEYAKKAVNEQEAKIVVFEFEEMTHGIQKELYNLQKLGIPVKYFTTKGKIVVDL